MTDRGSVNPWVAVVGVGAVAALALWLVMDQWQETPEAESGSAVELLAKTSAAPDEGNSLRAAPGDAQAPSTKGRTERPITGPIDETSQRETQATAEPSSGESHIAPPGVEGETAPDDSDAPPVLPVPPRAPSQRIAEGGRLVIDVASLRDGDVLAVGLELGDEARGDDSRVVRIVSVDGRRIETTAALAAGSGSGLRLELDPEWLTPGRYMIEVKTAEKTHFPLRRYVLEVQ